jgi:hypothetical protein
VRSIAAATTPLGEAGTEHNFEQYGVYYDDVTKLDGAWKFTHRLFVPLYITPDCVTGQVVAPRSSLLRPN